LLSSNEENIQYIEIDEIVNILKTQFNNVIAFNAMDVAVNLGNPVLMGMVMLGVFAGSKIVPIPKKYYLDELKKQLDPKIVKLNLKAFETGYIMVKDYL
jgi:Pyruvate/2-oxoacid:ferredoxin oxidoreductase gamma subunit